MVLESKSEIISIDEPSRAEKWLNNLADFARQDLPYLILGAGLRIVSHIGLAQTEAAAVNTDHLIALGFGASFSSFRLLQTVKSINIGNRGRKMVDDLSMFFAKTSLVFLGAGAAGVVVDSGIFQPDASNLSSQPISGLDHDVELNNPKPDLLDLIDQPEAGINITQQPEELLVDPHQKLTQVLADLDGSKIVRGDSNWSEIYEVLDDMQKELGIEKEELNTATQNFVNALKEIGKLESVHPGEDPKGLEGLDPEWVPRAIDLKIEVAEPISVATADMPPAEAMDADLEAFSRNVVTADQKWRSKWEVFLALFKRHYPHLSDQEANTSVSRLIGRLEFACRVKLGQLPGDFSSVTSEDIAASVVKNNN